MDGNKDNLNIEETEENSDLIKDIEERIQKGEFSTNSIFIDSVVDEEELKANEECLEENSFNEEHNFDFKDEFDFQNDIIEGFDMKKFNEDFDKNSKQSEVELIEDIEGLQSIIDNIEKYNDKIQETSPGLFVFKKK
ncbi:Zn-finger domain-containing protein [Clostridium sediminicola]|uniref:hypothetical protein n=1 Tax=Clostridium sediminicola TaxID=3114879 RepID=UPI0031F1DE3D